MMDLAVVNRHTVANQYRRGYRSMHGLANIKAFGQAMPGSHPDIVRREFSPLTQCRAWRQFAEALDKAMAYSWRTYPSLYP